MQTKEWNALILTLITVSIMTGASGVYAADSLYKCKTEKDVTIYSEQPCAAKKNQKITIKDNTLDHTQLRKSPMYHAESNQYQGASNVEANSNNDGPAVGSMKTYKGAGFQPTPPSSTGSSANSPWQ